MQQRTLRKLLQGPLEKVKMEVFDHTFCIGRFTRRQAVLGNSVKAALPLDDDIHVLKGCACNIRVTIEVSNGPEYRIIRRAKDEAVRKRAGNHFA